MNHPLLRQLRNLNFYLAVWLLVAVIHLLVLRFNQDLSWQQATLDSLVFSALFALLGLSIWYPCKYIALEKSSAVKILENHAFAAAFLSLMWLGSAYAILMHFLASDEIYRNFLKQSIPWRVLIGILLYFVTVAFYYVHIYSENLKAQLTREAELKSLLQEAELKSLKFQINPHFIFNSLNSINALTMSNPGRAGEMTVKLADYLRYTLSKNEQQLTRFCDELESAKLYLEIEKVRFGDKIAFVEKIENGCLDVEVPSMILQPLFENAIKYGVYESLQTVGIRLFCRPFGDYLQIIVENDFDPEAVPTKGEGIGLQNIRNRLERLYRQKNLLTVEKEAGVFKVNLLIPKSRDDGKKV